MDSIGKYIRQYRTERKMRQEDLAEKANLSPNYIGMIERGEKIPSLETLIDILNALEISADMVLCDVLKTGYKVKSSVFSEKLWCGLLDYATAYADGRLTFTFKNGSTFEG